MWGFSQGEILGMREQFVDRLFDAPEALLTHRSSWTRSDYAHAVATGGFPEAVRRSRIPRRNGAGKPSTSLASPNEILQTLSVCAAQRYSAPCWNSQPNALPMCST